MAQGNIDASRRIVEAGFNEGGLEVLDELCAEGFVSHDPIAGDQDVEGVKGAFAGYRDAFPDLSFTIDEIFAADDKVVMRWTAQGTFQNEFMGLQPTGEKGDPVRGISIDRYDDDGMLAEMYASVRRVDVEGVTDPRRGGAPGARARRRARVPQYPRSERRCSDSTTRGRTPAVPSDTTEPSRDAAAGFGR